MSMLDQYDPVTGELVVSDKVRRPADRVRFQLNTGSESFVQQCFIEECDINNIVRKYMDVGSLGDQTREPLFGDFSAIPDYQDAFEIVRNAADAFAALPSDARTRFANDPANMMAFLADPANLEESYKLGLREKPRPSDADRIVEALGARQAASESPPATK